MYTFKSEHKHIPASTHSKVYGECIIPNGRTRVLSAKGFIIGEVTALLSGRFSAWRVQGRYTQCSGNVFTNPLDATAWVLR